jgi:4-hydroxy-4-methyl-2-oxoglutarate aldolase
VQSTLGCVNIPLVRGGVAVRPGDIIVADDDVVVVPAAADTLAAAGKRQASEEGETGKLASGVLGLDLYEMRPALEKAGLRYVKKLEDL